VLALVAALGLEAAAGQPAAAASAPVQVPGIDPRGVDPALPNPLTGLTFYNDRRRDPAWRQYRQYRRTGRRGSAGHMLKLAREPRFRWFGRWSRPLRRALGEYVAAAERRRQVPLLTVLRHQGRACDRRYTAGGPREDARTRAWYRAFARVVGDARVVIAFEPDSLGTVDCLAKHRRRARLDTLRYGVDVLSRLPNATVYLEGGASDWEPAARTAKLLRYIGIRKVRGFMLNVTHYEWTRSNVRYGLEVSRRTGGKAFVISTAFNGRGPVHYKRKRRGASRRINVWCHPLRRGLGSMPTTETSHPKVDAYLWIGRPGYSGGSCNGGPLPVGSWWPARALMFARYATQWESPPPRTRFGHYRRYTLRQLGGPRGR
jgi:endoglucanase